MNALIAQFLEFTKLSVAENSLRGFANSLQKFSRQFPGRETDSISPTDITGWIAVMQKAGLSGTTIKYHVAMARRFFAWLQEQRLLNGPNPCDAKKLPKITRIPPKKHAFTQPQFERVCKVLRVELPKSPWKPWLVSACIIAWHTGLRMSDVACLEWSAVDFAHDILTVRPMKRRNVGQELTIPIEPGLVTHLVHLRDQRDPNSLNPYVLPEMHGYYITENGRKRVVQWIGEACDLAGLPDHSFHSFRHGLVSRLINNGVDCLVVASITGQSIEVIQGYAHISMEAKRAALVKGTTLTQI